MFSNYLLRNCHFRIIQGPEMYIEKKSSEIFPVKIFFGAQSWSSFAQKSSSLVYFWGHNLDHHLPKSPLHGFEAVKKVFIKIVSQFLSYIHVYIFIIFMGPKIFTKKVFKKVSGQLAFLECAKSWTLDENMQETEVFLLQMYLLKIKPIKW